MHVRACVYIYIYIYTHTYTYKHIKIYTDDLMAYFTTKSRTKALIRTVYPRNMFHLVSSDVCETEGWYIE